MRRLYGVTDDRTQMTYISYLQMKDNTQWLICRTRHEHNGMCAVVISQLLSVILNNLETI